MKMQSALQRTLQALCITGTSILGFAPAHAADPVQVTADNSNSPGGPASQRSLMCLIQ